MRNVFDQYTQQENRLTHALACSLHEDPALMRDFVNWITNETARRDLKIVEQQVPGAPLPESESDGERRGLPDAFIYDEKEEKAELRWALAIESKVQARIDRDQIERHIRTARKHDFQNVIVLVIAPERPRFTLPRRTHFKTWPDIYSWFRKHRAKSAWAHRLTDYMQVLEAKMTADEQLNGLALTHFDGIPFNEDNPYTYSEAKRVLRQLMDELSNHRDLFEAGVNTRDRRRSAITGSRSKNVWDYFSPRSVNNEDAFTTYPHFVVAIHAQALYADLVIPNGIRGGLRRKVAELGEQRFFDLVSGVSRRLDADALRGATDAFPHSYLVQRRYLSRSGPTIEDASLRFDMRTTYRDAPRGVRHQPEWARMMYNVIVNKRSNMQFAFGAAFPHADGALRDAASALDRIAHAWIATAPLVAEFAPVSQ